VAKRTSLKLSQENSAQAEPVRADIEEAPEDTEHDLRVRGATEDNVADSTGKSLFISTMRSGRRRPWRR